MLYRGAMGAMALAAMLCAAPSGAWAFDEAKYPDLSGQWIGVRMPSCKGQPSFDPVKCWGTTQDAPLTAEYEALFKANLADQAAGGQGTNATSTCLAPGMPMVMNAHSPMEIIVLPETTYVRVDHIRDTLTDHRFVANATVTYGIIAVMIVLSLIVRRLLSHGGDRLGQWTGLNWLDGVSREAAHRPALDRRP